MEREKYIEENQTRKEKVVMIIYSLFTVIMLIVASFLSWADWVIPTIFSGLLISWWLVLKKVKNYRFRAFTISGIALGSFTVYGLFAESLFSILITMGAVVILLAILNIPEILYQAAGISLLLLLYHGFIAKTIQFTSIEDGTRKLLQVVSFFIIFCVTYYLVKTHVELKEELMETIKNLEKAEQSKDDFMANVSHEIRTPINTVCGMSEMVLREEITDIVREYAFDIQNAGRSLLSIVSDILDFTELQSGKMELVEENYNLTSTINDVINVASAQKSGKDIELIVDCDAGIPSGLVGDEQKIRRVIMNIVNNAIKFTERGCVTIIFSARKEEYGVNLCIKVQDTGIGMSDESLEKLFTTFNQVDIRKNRQEGGIGLGLAVSHALVKKMGGFINVSSIPGRGSEVQFVIPQKVLDETPIVSLKDPDSIHVAGYINMEKYQFSSIREGYTNTIKHLTEQLGITYRQCYNLQELKHRVKKEVYTHIFISWDEYCEDREYFEELSEEHKVILVLDRNKSALAGKKILQIYKPFYALSIAAVLNGENIMKTMEKNGCQNNRFVAPAANILVVDDNMMNLKVVEGLLRPYKIKVFTAISGKEALQKIERMDYDFVFMDHMMPEMDGVETLHRIRQKPGNYFKNVPIIALTANAIGGVREMFLAEGFQDFVAKPIELSVLERVLRRYIPENKILKAEEESVEEKPSQKTEQILRMPGIDVEKGKAYCGGSIEDYLEVLAVYHQTGVQNIPNLQEYYTQKDWKNYVIIVHAVKSTSKGIGAFKLSKMAEKMELAVKKGREDYIHKHHEEMMEEYQRIQAIIEENIKSEEVPFPLTDIQEIEQEMLEEGLHKLQENLDTFESAGVEEILEELAGYAYHGQALQELLKPVADKVKAFDFMGAAEELDALYKAVR